MITIGPVLNLWAVILIAALQKSAGMKPRIEGVAMNLQMYSSFFFFFHRVPSESIGHIGGRLQGTAGHYVKL